MLKKNLSKSALVVALLTTTVIWRGTTAYAEDPNQAFTLDPMIVTAQRTETRDLDTPATTNIITEQNIKEAGYKNVFDAIEHQVGLTSTGYGDAGQDFGFSSGRTVIRGYDRGTLVMVDGIPMNLKNYNSLDGIPIDMVQQIEIIKGAAGTLYGSEAMGGVVNVITKRPGGKTQVKVKGTVGNYYKDYGVTYAGEKLIVTASKEYSNKLTHSNAYPEGSSTDWWVGKGQKNRAGISAALTDEIGFTFIYQDGNITRGSNNDAKKVGSVYKKYNYRYDDKRITTGLTYNGKYNGIKALVGYNYRRTDDYKGEQKDLPDLLKMVPGVHVREVNGKGQYTMVSVRGSTAAQVGVFVDGVLFNLGGDAAADISTIPVHNVERIEVYRGYIPARFGGTFMGGVINIVTKRPTKANVQASFGKSSFGGYKGSLQIDAPLGGGALMVSINRDQSEGDFKYKNFDNDRTYKERLQYYYKDLENTTNRINKQISYDVGFGMEEPSLGKVTSIDEMVTRCAPGGDIYEVFWKQNPDDYGGRDVMEHDWEFYYAKYADPNYKENLYKSDQYQLDKLESAERWRKANDYKNTDAIIKWQDDHWLAKATWKNIRRHLPHPIDNNYAPLWTVDQDWAVNMPYGKPNMYYFRNQELTAKELLLGRRDTVGNLEWGWSINYLKQDKDYYIDDWQNLEKVLEATNSLNTLSANSLWSKYDSRRLGAKIDGSYKAGDRHLIEFLVDASKEKMDIDGWRMHDFENSSEDTRGRWRNYYEQEIFNAQVQDTITLNKKGDFWLTPSVRYNRSKILGRSDRYDEKNDPQNVKWFHQQDEQTDDKVTWQLALKKQFNDHFTLRATGGTYYRLLNMYEIAGDGAGIWPMPNVGGTDSVFPMPEEGKQWDVSAIWDGKALGADTAKFQLTYFGRDSENLLQLMSRNFFFFYTNAAKAKVNGLEIQADMSWQKWDVNLQATYTKPKDVFYDMTKLPGYDSNTIAGSLAYQPQWEGTARLTYRPDTNWSLFTQLRYVDWMVTDPIPLTTGAVKRQSSLTTMDVGVKYKFNKSLQLAVGCNDVLNKANDMYLNMYGNGEIRNIQYPIQGRTYYATLQYTY